ncbi:DUF4262 domain-containing protein [Shewanella sp. Isolate11]|uniref:DUF4262 domain-containing protein n=1 Tax=Shewanella sp. Isolate11 TaxID=2908530 RepID=UPI001EFC68ED|nr:DUF4262 domain-containing protein [Shewanella sp. Isolate11]MCG9698292.1 DUF4262 domain-containing protein [Shewanella sp. Isolate11]
MNELLPDSEKCLQGFKKEIDKNKYTIVTVSDQLFYTIGMAKHNLPDVILICDINKRSVNILFENLFERWRTTGYAKGFLNEIDALPIFMDEIRHNTALRRVKDEYVMLAEAFYKQYPTYAQNKPRYVQMLWPDLKGYYPNESEYHYPHFEQKCLSKLRKII